MLLYIIYVIIALIVIVFLLKFLFNVLFVAPYYAATDIHQDLLVVTQAIRPS